MRSFPAETIRKSFPWVGSATVSFNLVPYTLKLANFTGSSPIPNRQTLSDYGAEALTRGDGISAYPRMAPAKTMRRIALDAFYRYSVLAEARPTVEKAESLRKLSITLWPNLLNVRLESSRRRTLR